MIEAGASWGAVLTGRFRPGDADAAFLGSGFAPGGHLALQVSAIRLGFVFERLPRKDSGHVDQADAYLGAIASGLALCGDASWSRGDVTSGGVLDRVTAYQGGVTLGIVPKPPEGRPRPRT